MNSKIFDPTDRNRVPKTSEFSGVIIDGFRVVTASDMEIARQNVAFAKVRGSGGSEEYQYEVAGPEVMPENRGISRWAVVERVFTRAGANRPAVVATDETATIAVRTAVSSAIKDQLSRWIAAGAPSAQYINSGGGKECGCCVDFADELYWALSKEGIEVDEFGVDSFLSRNHESDDGSGNPFDRALLTKYWPLIVPPAGFTWDDLALVSADAGFWPGTHQWVHVGGQHFDAECPEGVDNFFDLPFFKRVLASWRAQHSAVTCPTD